MPHEITKVVLAEKLAMFEEPWSPRIVAELNGQHVKVAKLAGEFMWHEHEDEDELFLVLSGRLRMELRDQGAQRSDGSPAPAAVCTCRDAVTQRSDPLTEVLELGPGELVVIPRGVLHRPVAIDGECAVLLFEPASTVNTGSAPEDPRTRTVLERI